MASTTTHRREFAQRLATACDRNPHIPPPAQGRQQVIADRLGLAPEAVSKWFKAKSMPRLETMNLLSEMLGVDRAWLHFGDEPAMTKQELKTKGRENEGAIHLVWGLIALSGGHCGVLANNDPRSSYVHFVATVRGTAYPVNVSLGHEVSPGKYELQIPDEFREVRNIAVIPLGGGKFVYLDLDVAGIEKHKAPKGSGYLIVTERATNGKFSTKDTTWAKIGTFAEFADY